jgi:hypothetical protein
MAALPRMERISQLVETAFMIAWEYLQATGELDEPEASARQLLDTIEVMIQRGERRRLLLANVAIDVYKRNRKRDEVRHGQPDQAGAA